MDINDITSMHKRACSGLDCQNVATRQLKIKFSDKTGFFCEHHANEFLLEGILEDMKTTTDNSLDYNEGNLK
jgi:hypothetical protein